MWVPFIVLMIGVAQLGPGTHSFGSIDEMPEMMKYSLLFVGIFFVLTFVFMFASVAGILGSFFFKGRQKARIYKYGRPGKAMVLNLYETGMTVNQQPLVGFELEVRPTSGAIFKTKAEQVIRRLDLPRIQPGTEIEIKYDPKSRKVVIV